MRAHVADSRAGVADHRGAVTSVLVHSNYRGGAHAGVVTYTGTRVERHVSRVMYRV